MVLSDRVFFLPVISAWKAIHLYWKLNWTLMRCQKITKHRRCRQIKLRPGLFVLVLFSYEVQRIKKNFKSFQCSFGNGILWLIYPFLQQLVAWWLHLSRPFLPSPLSPLWYRQVTRALDSREWLCLYLSFPFLQIELWLDFYETLLICYFRSTGKIKSDMVDLCLLSVYLCTTCYIVLSLGLGIRFSLLCLGPRIMGWDVF